jgi:PEP-CTERM motif
MRSAIKTVLGVATLAAASIATAAPVSGQGDWETTLQARDLDGNGSADAYYDTTLNISWLADANVAGLLDFNAATAWATGLDVAGVTGWHLPTININSCGTDGYGPIFAAGGGICGYNVQADTSDMAHLHLVTLGNPSASGQVDPTLQNTGPFANVQAYGYWFSQDYAVNPWSSEQVTSEAWRYSFHAGRQDNLDKSSLLFAWAVHDGDVGQIAAPVPEPETYALMLAGLALIVPLTRRRRRAGQD